jgi:hypothetical protein
MNSLKAKVKLFSHVKGIGELGNMEEKRKMFFIVHSSFFILNS